MASGILALQTVLVLVLILANGVFAAAEMAMVAARPGRLRRLSDRGNTRATAALELVANRSRFLPTVQIGITFVATLASAVGGAAIATALAEKLAPVPVIGSYAPAAAFALVVLAITYLSLVLGELVPKRLALQSPERTAIALAPPMRALSRAVGPLADFLATSSEVLIGLLGQRKHEGPQLTVDDIGDLVRIGAEIGILEPDVREIIERVLGVGSRQARNLMTPRTELAALSVRQHVGDAVTLIKETGFHKIPVYRGKTGDIVGVVDARVLVGAADTDQRPVTEVADAVKIVPETLGALQVLSVLQDSGLRFAVVIDEYGSTAGIVTLDDVLGDIVGELGDVHLPPDEDELVMRPDGSILVDAGMDVQDLRAHLGLDPLPGEMESDFETLAGFVLRMLNRVPSIGDSFDYEGYRFEVIDMDARRIDRVLVERMPTDGKSD